MPDPDPLQIRRRANNSQKSRTMRTRPRHFSILARALKECDAQAFAYCLMGNHYHFVL